MQNASGQPSTLIIWQVSKLPRDFTHLLKQARVSRVALMTFDGTKPHGTFDENLRPDVLQSLRESGIEVFGYGSHVLSRSASFAAREAAHRERLTKSGLDGYLVSPLPSSVSVTEESAASLFDALSACVKGRPLGLALWPRSLPLDRIPASVRERAACVYQAFDLSKDPEAQARQMELTRLGMKLHAPCFPAVWCDFLATKMESAAHAQELSRVLSMFPGALVFRAPKDGEHGPSVWDCDFGPPDADGPEAPPEELKKKHLPTLSRRLRLGDLGPDVDALREALLAQGFDAKDSSPPFGARTLHALKYFQTKAGLTPDGVCGPLTWASLGGVFHESLPESSKAETLSRALASFAEQEAKKSLRWTDKDCEAEKYLEPFRPVMRRLGQIGDRVVFYDWCGAFAAYCARHVGIKIPDVPQGFWASMAEVEAWIFWAKSLGAFYEDLDTRRGDLVLFDWNRDGRADHIAICTHGQTPKGTIRTAEGNRGNESGNFERSARSVLGVIRLT